MELLNWGLGRDGSRAGGLEAYDWEEFCLPRLPYPVRGFEEMNRHCSPALSTVETGLPSLLSAQLEG